MPEQTIALSQLESRRWESANILRAPVDAADFKTYIFPLLFFKRICDARDEEHQEIVDETGESHRSQIPKDCHWNGVRTKSSNVGTTHKNVNSDVLGDAYEYLIKKFAGATNKKAVEFYTPRSVVRLMTDMPDPKEAETIYDPACGIGGMLLAAVEHEKEQHGDVKRLWGKLYRQEKNLANPYSIKQSDREDWSSDKWGHNTLGTPPQGRADYAFQQHILTSLTAKGCSAVFCLHGVQFRNEEHAMRAKMVELDRVEAVIGLGPNLFYNSPMESCIVICNRKKAAARKGKVIFIDGVTEVTRERAQSFLKPEHQQRILAANQTFGDVPGLAKVATLSAIAANAGNLSIPLYVKRIATDSSGDAVSLRSSWEQWQTDGHAFWKQMDALVDTLDGLVDTEVAHA